MCVCVCSPVNLNLLIVNLWVEGIDQSIIIDGKNMSSIFTRWFVWRRHYS